MADRYVDQATQQLAPVYDQQIGQLNAQVPAIQQLYQGLTDALKTQNTQQLNTGVQNISEDASARGVLRSTLPVDARTALTSQLGAALNQGLGQIGLQQTQTIGDIQNKIAGLGVNKAQNIADLSNTLRTTDLAQQQFDYQKQFDAQKLAYQKQVDAQNFALESQKIAISRAAASAKSSGFNPGIATQIDQTLTHLVGKDGKVSPGNYSQAKVLWTSAGGKASDFNAIFGPKYAEGASSPIQQYYK